MSLCAQFDESGEQAEFVSNNGWTEFNAWARKLDAGRFAEVNALCEHGECNDIKALGTQIVAAIKTVRPDPTVESTARNLLAALAQNAQASAVYITNGMQPDTADEKPKSMSTFILTKKHASRATAPSLLGAMVWVSSQDGKRFAARVKHVHGLNAVVNIAIPSERGKLCVTDALETVSVDALIPLNAAADTNAVKRFDASITVGVDMKALKVIRNEQGAIVDYLDVFFDGYASTFKATTPEDRDGDYVLDTAFRDTLADFRKNPVMLTDHENEVGDIAGSYERIGVDSRGLFVRGKVSNSPNPSMVHKRFLIVEGHLRTLSIGGFFYYLTDGKGIERVRLFEISLVAIPANPDALFNVRAVTLDDAKRVGMTWMKGGPGSDPQTHDGPSDQEMVREIVQGYRDACEEDGHSLSDPGEFYDWVKTAYGKATANDRALMRACEEQLGMRSGSGDPDDTRGGPGSGPQTHNGPREIGGPRNENGIHATGLAALAAADAAKSAMSTALSNASDDYKAVLKAASGCCKSAYKYTKDAVAATANSDFRDAIAAHQKASVEFAEGESELADSHRTGRTSNTANIVAAQKAMKAAADANHKAALAITAALQRGRSADPDDTKANPTGWNQYTGPMAGGADAYFDASADAVEKTAAAQKLTTIVVENASAGKEGHAADDAAEHCRRAFGFADRGERLAKSGEAEKAAKAHFDAVKEHFWAITTLNSVRPLNRDCKNAVAAHIEAAKFNGHAGHKCRQAALENDDLFGPDGGPGGR